MVDCSFAQKRLQTLPCHLVWSFPINFMVVREELEVEKNLVVLVE